MLKAKRAVWFLLLFTLAGTAARAAVGGSSTSLAISPSGSVTAGTAVTLTATVALEPSGDPAPRGTVIFCNAAAAHCEDSAVFGTAQVQSSGAATFKFVPGVGTYSITAIYVGISGSTGSTSSAQPLTVSGASNYTSSTQFSTGGSVGSYNLSAQVTAFGSGAMPGTISFLDTSNGNASLATAPLNPASLNYTLVNAPAVTTDVLETHAVIADFNGDGINDIAVINYASGDISVALGNGDGTFQPQTTTPLCGDPFAIAAGDFNGDGKADLAVSCQSSYSVMVLISNGDGTFSASSLYPDGQPHALAVGDFSNDGNLDIAVGIEPDSYMQVFLGDGTGNFTLASFVGDCEGDCFFQVGNEAWSAVAADFNGDGNLDLAVTNAADGTVSILLGNGDGTFQNQMTIPVGSSPRDLAVADFNGDGSPDIAVANSGDASVSILLNNHDGTGEFTAQPPLYPGDQEVYGIAAADLNADGKMDLVVTDDSGGAVDYFLGNGDGTFPTEGTVQSTGTGGAYAVTTGDLNGDGLPDLVVTNNGNGETASVASIFLSAQSETATTTGVAIAGGGMHNVLASYPGDTERAASQSTTEALQGDTATSTAFSASPTSSTYGQSVTFTATVTPAPEGDTYGTVSFYNGETLLGSGNVNASGVATLATTALPVGTLTLYADYNGNGEGFDGSNSTGLNFVVSQATTTTAITSVTPSTLVEGQSATLTATVSPIPDTNPSRGTVSFFNGATQIGSAVAVNSSGVATLDTSSLAAGPLALTAVYSGNTDYAGSPSSVDSLVVLAATTTALTASPSPATFGTAVILTATVTPNPGAGGTVAFSFGSTSLGTGNVNASGIATITTSALPVGADGLSAVYSGNTNYNTSSGTLNLTVNTVPTTTVLTASPTSSTFGASVMLTATLTPAPDNVPSYGTVTFYNGATQIGAAAAVNSSGVATLTTSALPVGTLSLTATYAGNTDYAGSTSTALPFAVSQVTTATALTASPNPVTAGQTETLTATVTPTPTGTSYGTVTFYNAATQVGTGNVNSSGVASITTTSLPTGALSLTAVYSGNTDFAGSTSSATSLTVLVATTTTLTATPSPATYGQTVTMTATVAPAPTGSSLGTVTFYNGATQLGAGSVNASGIATFTTNNLAVASYTLTADYSGNALSAASNSSTVNLTVNVAPTAVALTASPNPVTYAQTETLTATVTPAPTGSSLGTVTFYDGATQVGTGNVNSSGVATATSTTLPVGSDSLTAVYSGNTDFGGSTSSAQSLVVAQVATTAALALSPNPVVAGQTETLTATITPTPTGTSYGTVNFYNGATLLGTGNVNASGVATYSTASLAAGTPSLTATYSGNTDFAGSTSTAQTLTVLAVTATTLAGSPNPSTYTQSVTLTATVSPAPTGTALGTVNFFNGSTQLGTGNVNSSGVATLTTTSLPVGSLSLTAVYSGNAGFNGSTSGALSFTVNLAPTTTAVSASPSPATYGQSVTLTATVTPAPTGSSLGTVTFFNGETELGTGSVGSSGTATFASTTLSAGTLSITAVYSGNAGYAASTSSVFSLTVNTTYTVSAPETPYDLAEGGSANIIVTVPPLGGAYNSAVTMSATGLPPGATATFVPSSVTPGAAGANTMLTIQLLPVASGLLRPGQDGPRAGLFAAISGTRASPFLALFASLLLFAMPRRKRMARVLQFAVLILVAGLIGSALMGCSGGFLRPPSTQPGSYTVKITGTSGSSTQSTTVSVVVQ
ncbi:MAG TPA: Ig-like domain repeat protein [Candidatus Aquilonibacter sp.]|nr:Ig-like domain repeat protein [Candidatus Aquilonibacter sp.]